MQNQRVATVKLVPALCGALLAVLGLLALLAPAPVEAATRPVRVRADAGWVASGIGVDAGDVVTLAARGQAITGPLRDFPLARSGPGGQTWNDPCGTFLPAGPCSLDGAPYGMLIGRIGPGGTPFEIGDASSFVADGAGELFLAVNDNVSFYDDNQGGFIVLIR